MSAAGDKDWFTADALASFYEMLATYAGSTPAIVPADATTAAAERAGRVLYRYALAASRGDASAATLADEVRELAPEVVIASERAADGAADAHRDLAGLRNEQETVRRRLEAMEQRLESLAGRATP